MLLHGPFTTAEAFSKNDIILDLSFSVSLHSHVTCSLSSEGFEFFETSAKDNINVKQTFERLVDLICDKMSESLDTDSAVTTGAPTAKLTDSAPPLQQPGCNC